MSKRLNILFIEDDAIEVMKLRRTVALLPNVPKIIEAKNGEEAIEQLQSGDPLPDILLLDLNMPKISGIEFLRILKSDNQLKYLPVIILTTSNNRKDVLECYKIGIAGYIIKPFKFEDYEVKLKALIDYWSQNELINVSG
ncbi:response regulator [Gramella sp. MAR_2010_147]|uniref:response regulator n=1 Tax=Gramella sp. MAR_2010_147 TaxID=1250205 RepID=UPI00087B778D|nr:response regulator [Gramella sp. MAR_2010_147]SDS21929.1 Response regulator receiver domain-containing protein [Gramella sp. MAR_2010_147]